jgi:hypothetical protein
MMPMPPAARRANLRESMTTFTSGLLPPRRAAFLGLRSSRKKHVRHVCTCECMHVRIAIYEAQVVAVQVYECVHVCNMA